MNILTELEKLDTQNRILKIKELIDERTDNIAILKDIKIKFESDFNDAVIQHMTELRDEYKKAIKEISTMIW